MLGHFVIASPGRIIQNDVGKFGGFASFEQLESVLTREITYFSVAMDEKTFLSLLGGEPLPSRRNLVVSSQSFDGVETFPTLDEALLSAKKEQAVYLLGGQDLLVKTFHMVSFICLISKSGVAGKIRYPEIGGGFSLTGISQTSDYKKMSFRRKG